MSASTISKKCWCVPAFRLVGANASAGLVLAKKASLGDVLGIPYTAQNQL